MPTEPKPASNEMPFIGHNWVSSAVAYLSSTTQLQSPLFRLHIDNTSPPKFEPESAMVVVIASPTTQASANQKLAPGYHDLGEALNQLVHPELDEEWRVETGVYKSACIIAAQLIGTSIPAPRIFTHGTGSVVFSWSTGIMNRYLTISTASISVLISTPERIESRSEYPLGQGGWPSQPGGYLAAMWSKASIAVQSPKAVRKAMGRKKRRDRDE